jgi:hypothetical protein
MGFDSVTVTMRVTTFGVVFRYSMSGIELDLLDQGEAH